MPCIKLTSRFIGANNFYQWVEQRFNQFLDVGLSQASLENVNIQQQISPFTKISATVKAIPDKRRQIRQQINDYQVSFTQILNEFIGKAKDNLKRKERSKLVVIADNLDRIQLVKREDGSTNHEEIFIDRSEQLRSLDCHVIYTVPISLVYSNRSTILKENYGDTQVLPMIMIRDQERNPFPAGVAKIKELINKRIKEVASQFIKKQNLSVNPNHGIEITCDDIFDALDTVDLLCDVTGGHVREIMFLMQESLNWIDEFPITKSALNRAIAISRNTYENQVDNKDWQKLIDIYNRKKIINEDDYRQLLFTRCVLEYRDPDTLKVWHAVHPLIERIDEFQRLLKENADTLRNS